MQALRRVPQWRNTHAACAAVVRERSTLVLPNLLHRGHVALCAAVCIAADLAPSHNETRPQNPLDPCHAGTHRGNDCRYHVALLSLRAIYRAHEIVLRAALFDNHSEAGMVDRLPHGEPEAKTGG